MQNYNNYIKGGMNMVTDKKRGLLLILGSGLWALLGGLMGFLFGGICQRIAILMICIFLLITLFYFLMFLKKDSDVALLIQQLLISMSVLFQISLFQVLIFCDEFGWRFEIVWFYIPLIIPPMIMGVIIDHRLKSGKPFSSPAMKLGTVGASGVFVGRYWAKSLNTSDEVTTIIVFVLLTFVNMILSLGFLNFQRIYYCLKKRKTGDG